VSTSFVTFYLAMLAVVAEVAVVGAAVLAAGSWISPRVVQWRRDAVSVFGPSALLFAAAVAIVCTLGSLYLSEVAHFVPCKLCWYQRVAMYPLAPVLLLAAVRREAKVWPYALLVAVVGASLSTYHILVERFPSLSGSASCDPANPCTIRWVERFGYLTIPGMALSGFALIAVLLLTARRWSSSQGGPK